LLATNADVPLLVVSVGAAAPLAEALAELRDRLNEPLITVERVRVLKRGGHTLADLGPVPEADGSGLSFWQKLTVYTGEHARHGRHPLSIELIHRLRLEGAAGATAVRGIWGFSSDHPPHGDRLRSIRRRVPVVVSVVDRPEAAQRWWRVIDGLTSEGGLVTSELVPAFHAVGPSGTVGGLRLAGSDPEQRN
jgi:PII-like signaling protein